MTVSTLAQEYEKLNRTFGWSKDHFLQFHLNTLGVMFIPNKTKQRLAERLRAAYASHD
jgi:hypothetical protein